MPAQKRYRIDRNYKRRETGEWTGWAGPTALLFGLWADTWQGAIKKWIARDWAAEEYTVVSETPSEDDKSGIIEIQLDTPLSVKWVGAKFEATLIDD